MVTFLPLVGVLVTAVRLFWYRFKRLVLSDYKSLKPEMQKKSCGVNGGFLVYPNDGIPIETMKKFITSGAEKSPYV